MPCKDTHISHCHVISYQVKRAFNNAGATINQLDQQNVFVKPYVAKAQVISVISQRAFFTIDESCPVLIESQLESSGRFSASMQFA
jgi:hypothetical protein